MLHSILEALLVVLEHVAHLEDLVFAERDRARLARAEGLARAGMGLGAGEEATRVSGATVRAVSTWMAP